MNWREAWNTPYRGEGLVAACALVVIAALVLLPRLGGDDKPKWASCQAPCSVEFSGPAVLEDEWRFSYGWKDGKTSVVAVERGRMPEEPMHPQLEQALRDIERHERLLEDLHLCVPELDRDTYQAGDLDGCLNDLELQAKEGRK